jgi:hypothetical protein
MIILNYLLAISLVILSVVKTADLFIQSDKALGKIQSQFIDHTKSLLKNEKGNISLTAAVLTALLSLLLLFYVTKMKIEYREALYRKDSYLCLRFINEQTKNYITEMAIFNWALRAAFAAQGSIIATAEAVEVFKGLTIARNIRHFYYLAKLSRNKYCHLPETAFYLKNTPFKIKSNLSLLTNIDETTIMRQKKWTYMYYQNPAGIRLKKSFCLKSEFQMEDVFIPKTTYTSSEVQIKDLSSLKCFSGLWSSPSS